MSAELVERNRQLKLWEQAGDAERLAMNNNFIVALRSQETDPERSFSQYTWCRDEARRLGEPWWELFFEQWRLIALNDHMKDFARALPLAAELMVRFNTPTGQAHESHDMVLDNILYIYASIDPLGYHREFAAGMAYLDRRMPQGPSQDRISLNNSRINYLMSLERWAEANDVAFEALALIDQSQDTGLRTWYTAWTNHDLCRTCHELGRTDELADHVTLVAELAPKDRRLVRLQANAAIWQAIVHRGKGEEKAARRALHQGLRHLEGLKRRDSVCADPLAIYYEMGGDFAQAVAVRDRELAEIREHGAFHRVCQLQIERCRLLSRMSKLTPDDFDAARQSFARVKVTDWYEAKLGRINPPGMKEL